MYTKYKKPIVIGVIVLAVVLVIFALMNSTYALFSVDAYGANTEVYSTGLLSIEASSKSENISLTNALPMTDEDGVNTTPYVFTIKNVGNLDYLFDVRMLSTGTSDTTFSPEYIKIQVDNGEVTTLSNLSNSEIKSDITLLAGESIDISIKVWLSIDTPNTQLGRSFNSKIVTNGQAVYTGNISGVNLMEHIKNLYTSSNPTLITHSKDDGTSDTYYYSYQDDTQTWGLMNDGLKVSSTEGAGATTITDETTLTSGTEGNIRYFGPSDSVNNYIYFNCSNYSDTSTCEKWRIIGIVDGKVKIIKDESIGNLAWDLDKNQDSSLTSYSNNWETSSLQLFLNGLYYNRGTTTSHTYYYYSDFDGFITTTLDLTTLGITEATRTNNLISETTWYLGGLEGSNDSDNIVYQNEIYIYERKNELGTTIYNSNPFSIETKIGLMYASDYAYASDLKICSSSIHHYDLNDDCIKNNWLHNKEVEWVITPGSGGMVWHVDVSGYVGYNPGGLSGLADYGYGVRPVLYLNTELAIGSEGDGSIDSPYRIYTEPTNVGITNLVEHITDLYISSNPVTVNDTTLGTTYYYSEKVGLMNDGLDSSGNATGSSSVGNIRYYGSSPNNYIYFNCDDYSSQSSSTCETWRIVGVIDGKVKIVRSNYIGRVARDYDYNDGNSATTYSHLWNTASLNTLLNDAYYNSKDNITYYSGSTSTTFNFASSKTGIKNDDTRDLIAESKWYTYSENLNTLYPNAIYKLERTEQNTWTGNVALLNASDYAYASNLNSCKQLISAYNNTNCVNTNWLLPIMTSNGSYYSWLLNSVDYSWIVAAPKYGITYTAAASANHTAVPAVYLKSDVVISSVGNGTSSSPYRIVYTG